MARIGIAEPNKRTLTLQTINEKAAPILRNYSVSFAGVFGSRARGEERPESDLDLLIRFSTPKSLFDLVGLEYDLEKVLKCKVDVVTEGALHPLLKTQVFHDLKSIYGER